jgi:PAS domain S-box-containing protein
MTDAEGRITFYNEAAATLWGCRPELGERKFCGSWKLYWPDGTLLPHDECPMALALRQRRPIRGMEAVAERPDGTRVHFIPYPTPLFDHSGTLTGAVTMLVDISERKRVEAALAERQAQLAVFVEHAPAAIAMFDREMRYLAVSRRYILDFRLPQDAQLIGRSHYEVFPDIPQRWRDVHGRVLAGEELSQAEDQFTRQDGCTHWVRWSMAPWRRADGSIGGALLFSEHRTEQVEARRALIDSEARFRGTFENAAVGVAMVGPNGSILRANNSFARMLGYSVEELKTKTFRDLTHPEDLATNLSVLNKTLVGEADSYSIEKRYVRKDGGVVWASLTVGCVRNTDGGVDYFISVVQDITDRKHAEARLAERNEQLDLAGKIARIGTFTYDHATQKLQLSPGCAVIYGLLPESTVEISREHWRALVHPDDLPRLDTIADRAFSSGETEFVLEFRIIRHGELRWIESRVLVSYNEFGRPVRRIGANIDVTERKRAEQALAERNIQLTLAAKSGLVGTYAYDVDTEIMQISDGYAAIHGFPEGTTKIARSECLAGLHSDDIERVEQFRSEAFRECRHEYSLEHRIIRPGGELRWVETRCFLSFSGQGEPRRVVGVSIDITERKQTERALAERNLQMLLAGKSARVGSYTYDVGSDLMQVSEGYVAVHGLPDGTKETTRGEWRARTLPEDLTRVEAVREQAFRERLGEYAIEYRIVRSNGEVRWIESRSFVSYDGEGRPERVVGVNIDITERIRATQVAQRLASIVESSDDAIVSQDLNGVVVTWNKSAERLFGYSADEVIGKPILFLIPTDRQHEELTILQRIRSGKPINNYETVRRHKNGAMVDISLTVSPLRNIAGVVVGVSKVARDIGDRKKAEAVLAERTMQLAIAGRAALVGSFAYDVATERLQLSPGYAAIHGFPEGTTEIARTEWLAGVHPEDRERWEALRSRAHRGQWPEYSGEYRIVRSGVEVRWIEARVFVLYASDGRPQRAVGVDIDVTARKRADEQQRTLNAELDHRVKNVLATVSAIITQTPKTGNSLADFVVGLDGRIKSLARTHELLSENHWQDVSLKDIVQREIAPYAAGNATILGPGIALKPDAAQALATVLHELATNAAKYGAFSKPGGQLFVRWRWLRNGNGSHGWVAIQWRESGGPAVSSPIQFGYGTSIVRELIPFELGGKVDLAFASDGLQCRLEIPSEWVIGTETLGHQPQDGEGAWP